MNSVCATLKMARPSAPQKLHVGDTLPASPSHLVTLAGDSVSLVHDDHYTLVCVLRHLAWLPWQDHVERLLAQRDELFDTLQCRILFVSYSDPSRPLHKLWIETWCNNNLTGIAPDVAQMVLDPTKSLYEGWAIPSSQVAAWGPANTWYYIKAICCRGQRTVEVQGEAGQLGGDFLLAPRTARDDGSSIGGKVLMAYYCKNPTDRVAVSTILDTLKKAQKNK